MSGPMCGNCVYFFRDRDEGLKLLMGNCHIEKVRQRRRTAANHFCHLHESREGRRTKTVLIEKSKARTAQ